MLGPKGGGGIGMQDWPNLAKIRMVLVVPSRKYIYLYIFCIYTLNMVNLASSPQPQCPPTPHWTLGLTCDDFILSLGPLKAEIHAFSDGLSENYWKSQNERVQKFYSSALVFAGTVNFFSPTWRNVPGAYSEPFSDIDRHREHPEKVVSFKKEAERGWKSGARSLSWKGGWKPSTIWDFWHQRISGSFFCFRDSAIWRLSGVQIKFQIVNFRVS